LTLVFAALFAASCGRQAQPAPKPPAPPLFEFLGAWGNKGEDPGKLDQPVAFAIDATNRVLFVDPATNFVDKFETNGTPLLSFEDSRLRHASGITVDSGGAIYVADATHGIVMIFFPDGTFLRSVGTSAQPHFSGPLGIAVDTDGNLYVPDPAHSRVEKFDSHGRHVNFGPAPNGAIRKDASPDERPSSVATAQDGSVYVAYFKTGRIEKYSSDGSLVTSWKTGDASSPESAPITGFTVAGQFVFTMTASSPQIRVWTLDGQHKLDADLEDHLSTITLAAPQIAVTPHSELLVFDPSAPRIYWFRMHLPGFVEMHLAMPSETKEQE
jgi:sugar lactone lactonase YvrE